MRLRVPALGALTAVLLAWAPAAAAAEVEIGTTFPPGFDVPVDASLGTPVLGFGSAGGVVRRTPVVFLHGNNDTPYPTSCNESYGKVRDFAQSFLEAGWSPKELWALGYQGDQCDLQTDQTRRAGEAHTTLANVPDLRAFVNEVLAYTGASQVDIVGHSLGTTLAREWMRQDDAYGLVRRLVGVDGPNHGIINCSPSPQNYYVSIGFTPDSPVCLEYGAADTPMLAQLNAGDETPGPTEYLAIVNADASFVYISAQDGVFPPVPAEDREGRPHDFSRSAHLEGAQLATLTGQGRYDGTLLAAHTGIVNSPEVWSLARDFLAPVAVPAPSSSAAPSPPSSAAPATPAPMAVARPVAAPSLPATGPTSGIVTLAGLALAAAGLGRRAARRR